MGLSLPSPLQETQVYFTDFTAAWTLARWYTYTFLADEFRAGSDASPPSGQAAIAKSTVFTTIKMKAKYKKQTKN